MTTATDIAQAVTAVERTIDEVRSLDDTLQTIVEVAGRSVPGFDQVGISTRQNEGLVLTRAFVGDLVVSLDTVQHGLGEGPCSAVLQGDAPVCIATFKLEPRWPHYVPHARASGVRSQMAVRLVLTEGTLGGMSFYSTTADDVSPDAVALARLFGTHAAIALGQAQQPGDVNTGMQTRRVIGQALGILMERYQVTEDRAFAFLVRMSSHSNVPLREVAQNLVDERNAR